MHVLFYVNVEFMILSNFPSIYSDGGLPGNKIDISESSAMHMVPKDRKPDGALPNLLSLSFFPPTNEAFVDQTIDPLLQFHNVIFVS